MTNPRQLVVEGYEDQGSVIFLMAAHIEWPDGKENAPVYIHIGNSADQILREGYLTASLKSRGIRMFGVILDADTSPKGRYESVRNRCSVMFPNMPIELPNGGLVVANEDGLRFGVWIMPDNVSEGSLETFLRYLVTDRSAALWSHGEDSVAKARTLGADCRETHLDKANLYTWLAWQDPPGQKYGPALAKKVLDPESPSASAFVSWFRELYQL